MIILIHDNRVLFGDDKDKDEDEDDDDDHLVSNEGVPEHLGQLRRPERKVSSLATKCSAHHHYPLHHHHCHLHGDHHHR